MPEQFGTQGRAEITAEDGRKSGAHSPHVKGLTRTKSVRKSAGKTLKPDARDTSKYLRIQKFGSSLACIPYNFSSLVVNKEKEWLAHFNYA